MDVLEVGVVFRWILKGFRLVSCWCGNRFSLVLALPDGPDLFFLSVGVIIGDVGE